MLVILMTTLFYKALILQGEIWCWSLLGLFKKVKIDSRGQALLDFSTTGKSSWLLIITIHSILLLKYYLLLSFKQHNRGAYDSTMYKTEPWSTTLILPTQHVDVSKRKDSLAFNRVLLLTNLFSLVFAFLQVAFNLSWILVRSDKSSLDSLLAKLVRNFIQTEKQDQNIWLFYEKA